MLVYDPVIAAMCFVVAIVGGAVILFCLFNVRGTTLRIGISVVIGGAVLFVHSLGYMALSVRGRAGSGTIVLASAAASPHFLTAPGVAPLLTLRYRMTAGVRCAGGNPCAGHEGGRPLRRAAVPGHRRHCVLPPPLRIHGRRCRGLTLSFRHWTRGQGKGSRQLGA